MPIEELEKMLRETPSKPAEKEEKIEDLVQEPEKNPDETAMFTPEQAQEWRKKWSKIQEPKSEEVQAEDPNKNPLEDLLEE